jgi:hypothetical protein
VAAVGKPLLLRGLLRFHFAQGLFQPGQFWFVGSFGNQVFALAINFKVASYFIAIRARDRPAPAG